MSTPSGEREPDERTLARQLRALPRSSADQTTRAREGGATLASFLVHLGALIVVLTLPDHAKIVDWDPNESMIATVEPPVYLPTPREEEEEKEEERPREELKAPPVVTPRAAEASGPRGVRARERRALAPARLRHPRRAATARAAKRRARKHARRALNKAGAPSRSRATTPVMPGPSTGPSTASAGTGRADDPPGPITSAPGTAPGSAEPSPAVPDIDRGALLSSYASRVARAVNTGHRYPRTALRRGAEGTVLVQLTIDGAGIILATSIARSSGHRSLDKAALRAIRRLERVPAPPKPLSWSRKTLRVPFVYKLGG